MFMNENQHVYKDGISMLRRAVSGIDDSKRKWQSLNREKMEKNNEQ